MIARTLISKEATTGRIVAFTVAFKGWRDDRFPRWRESFLDGVERSRSATGIESESRGYVTRGSVVIGAKSMGGGELGGGSRAIASVESERIDSSSSFSSTDFTSSYWPFTSQHRLSDRLRNDTDETDP